MALKDLLIRLGVKGDKKAKQKIKGVDGSLKGLGKSAIKAGAAFFGARALIEGLKTVISLESQQTLAVKKLETALGKNSNALQKQAAALQQVTTFGDEVIIEAQAMLAMFIKDEEQLKKATVATMDLAAAKGMDLVQAADLVGKSVGSSTNALSRYGVQTSAAAGSTERLNEITGNMTKFFGGQATAVVDTMSGRLDQMKNAMGDAGETMGEILSPAVEESAKFIKKLAEDVDTSLKAFKKIDLGKTGENFLKSSDALMKAVKGIFKLYVDLLPDMWKKAFNKLLPIAKKIFQKFIDLTKEIALLAWEPLVISLNHVGERIKQGFVFLINEGILKPLGFLVEKINSVGSLLGFEEIKPFNLLEKVQVDPLLDKLKETKIGQFITPTEDDITTIAEFTDASAEVWAEYFETIKVLKEEEKAKDLQDHIDNEEEKANATKKNMMQLTKDEKKKLSIFKQRFDAAVAFANSLDAHKKMLRDNEMNAEIQAVLKSQMTEEQKESAIANIKEVYRQKDIQAARKMKMVKKAEAIINTAVAVTEAIPDWIKAGLVAAKGAVEVATIEAQQFAGGGIVQGNPSQGDTVPVMATAGELILNQAQQENLTGNMGVTVNISGNIVGNEEFVRDTLIPEIKKATFLA